jgi:hypothetical protein
MFLALAPTWLLFLMVSTRGRQHIPPPVQSKTIASIDVAVAPGSPVKVAQRNDEGPRNLLFTRSKTGEKLIRCSDYGFHRDIIFPGTPFCAECRWWEEKVLSKEIGRAKRTSANFECQFVKSKVATKRHKSFLFPWPYNPATSPLPPSPKKFANSRNKKRKAAPRPGALKDYTSDGEEAAPLPVPAAKDYTSDGEELFSDDSSVDSSTVVSTDGESDDDSDEDEQLCRFIGSILPQPKKKPVSEQAPNESPAIAAPAQEPIVDFAQQQTATLKRALHEKQKQLKAARRRITNLEGCKTKLPPSSSGTKVASLVSDFIQKEAARTNRNLDTASRNLTEKLFHEKKGILSDEKKKAFLNALKKPVLEEYRKDNYSAPAVSRLQDISGGAFSLSTCDLFRTLENKGEKYVHGCVMPSSGSIKRVRKVVERYGRKRIKTRRGKMKGSKGGEFFEFDIEDLLLQAIEAFGLSDVAKYRAVRINVSIDGAQLSKRLTHVTIGFKIVDIAARCPFTGRPLFMDSDPALLQSRNVCIPCKIGMCKETKAVFKDEFKSVFLKFHQLSDKFEGERINGPFFKAGYKPLKIAINCDMSATWKLFDVGGAAGVHTTPCHCCPVTSKHLGTPRTERCGLCIELHPNSDDEWKCYHHSSMTSEKIEEMMIDFEEAEESLGVLLDVLEMVRRDSSLSMDENPRVPVGNSRTDPTSIHFLFSAQDVSEQEGQAYADDLINDLALRDLRCDGSIPDLQKRLKESLIKEWKYLEFKRGKEHGEKLRKAIFMIMENTPCILHSETRVGIAILFRLLSEGLENAHHQRTYKNLTGEKQRRMKFVEDVEVYINTHILGGEFNPAQFTCPIEDDYKKIGTICLCNNRVRKLVNGISGLLDYCVCDASRKAEWSTCIDDNYSLAMRLLRKKRDLTEAEICQFQKYIDLFFQSWVNLHEGKGITNYIHMLGSGHFFDYLKYWKSLYPHSQQGWEALNSLIKTFYFRATPRGGLSGGGKCPAGDKTQVGHLGRWLLRRMVWVMGASWEDMEREWVEQTGKRIWEKEDEEEE